MIKSNLTEAYSASELLSQNTGYLEAVPLTGTYETNIPAIEDAFQVYAQIEMVKRQYKETLCADAENIASLGEAFEQFDQAVEKKKKSIF